MRHPKKSKYKSVVIKKKRYYFYKITWLDITGDSGHADLHTAEGFMPSEMVTHAYLLNKDKKRHDPPDTDVSDTHNKVNI